MKYSIFLVFSLMLFIPSAANSDSIKNPADVLSIEDWSFYGTWGSVAIIHNIVIENRSDKAYKNPKVRICYTTDSSLDFIASTEVGELNIVIPPRSKKNYFKDGTTLGAGAQSMKAVKLEIIDAEIAD